tara:strand:- start:509 stop:1060 length:552 start_codon:yes stop_codon:yes gene_type:complete
MNFIQLELSGGYLIKNTRKEDERGSFSRVFCTKVFKEYGLNTNWVQISSSYTKNKNALRGLHYQKDPYQEDKLIRCVKGSIWDVIVDIRKDSETYGKYYATELSPENNKMIYAPKGFAHGFITNTEHCEVEYYISEYYMSAYQGAILWNDKKINIKWPNEPTEMSMKDRNASTFNDYHVEHSN